MSWTTHPLLLFVYLYFTSFAAIQHRCSGPLPGRSSRTSAKDSLPPAAWDESKGWADPSLQTITRPGGHWVTTNIHSHNSMVWLHVSACLSLYFQHLSTFLSLPSGPSSAWESHPTVDAKISQARPRRRNDRRQKRPMLWSHAILSRCKSSSFWCFL